MNKSKELNEIDNIPSLGYGADKYVVGPDANGYVYKFFKAGTSPLSIEDQIKNIDLKRKYFWKFIPETKLCWDQDRGGYYIKQKYIHGKSLKDIDIQTLSSVSLSQLIDFLNCYLSYAKASGRLDLTWWNDKNNQYVWWKRMLYNFLLIRRNFLASSNIIVADTGEVYMIDIADTKDSLKTFVFREFKNFCAKPFIVQTRNQLYNLLLQKTK